MTQYQPWQTAEKGIKSCQKKWEMWGVQRDDRIREGITRGFFFFFLWCKRKMTKRPRRARATQKKNAFQMWTIWKWRSQSSSKRALMQTTECYLSLKKQPQKKELHDADVDVWYPGVSQKQHCITKTSCEFSLLLNFRFSLFRES